MWKNCEADIQGLFHYRRFISSNDTLNALQHVMWPPSWKMRENAITEQKIIASLNGADIILCLPYPPYPLNGLEDLQRFVYWKDIKAMCEIIRENYPDYMPSLEHVFSLEHISYCNMFIARREFVNDYCAWLFDVLAKLEGRISLEGYDTQHKRVYGYLAEVLLNVYVHRHNLRRKYFQMIQLYEKSFPRYLLSCVKKAMKKISWLRRFVYAMRIRNISRKELYEKQTESRIEFLSGRNKRYGRKIVDVSSLRDYLSFYGIENAEYLETNSLIYAYKDLRYFIYHGAVAVFIPKHGADPRKIPGEIQSVIQEKEASEQGKGATDDYIIVLPRFVPNDETPDSLKNILAESGCRILEEV